MDCLFCKIRDDERVEKLYSDEHFFVISDIQPKAPIHWLIIPNEHITTIDDMSSDQMVWMGQIYKVAQTLTRTHGIAKAGYRLVFNTNAQGGQSVYHIHMHVLAGRQMNWPPG